MTNLAKIVSVKVITKVWVTKLESKFYSFHLTLKKYHKFMIYVLFKVYGGKAHNISKASSINQKIFCYGFKTQKKF